MLHRLICETIIISVSSTLAWGTFLIFLCYSGSFHLLLIRSWWTRISRVATKLVQSIARPQLSPWDYGNGMSGVGLRAVQSLRSGSCFASFEEIRLSTSGEVGRFSIFLISTNILLFLLVGLKSGLFVISTTCHGCPSKAECRSDSLNCIYRVVFSSKPAPSTYSTSNISPSYNYGF